MVLTSCVSVQGKARDAACLLPLSSALSLPLQTLDLNLLRIQHRGRRPRRQQQQQRERAQPPRHRSLKMHHPAWWAVFSVTVALLFIPGTRAGFSAPGAARRAWSRTGGKEGSPGKGECEMPVRGEVGLLCARTRGGSQQGFGVCPPFHGASGELDSRSAPCWEALPFLGKVPAGINQLWSQG